jgi:phage terminase large subunit
LKQITIPFKPREQQKEIFEKLKRFNVFVCHRRFGKTTLAINVLIRIALSKPGAFCAYIAPTFKQAKDVAWHPPDTSVKTFIRNIPNYEKWEQEGRVLLPNGSIIRLFGADDPDRLRGIGLDYVVIDEVSQMNPRTWTEIILPALSDKGGHAMFIGTPKGHNFLYDIWASAEDKDNWYRKDFKASETGIIDPDILEDLKEQMDDDTFQQEYECSFDAAIRGSYYGKLMVQADNEGRIDKVPFDPAMLVYAAFDIGVDDATSIWFYQKPKDGTVRIIDYFEDSGEGLPYYIKHCRNKPYDIAMYYFPHDITVKEFGSGKTRIQTLKDLEIRNYRIVPKTKINEGIDSVRRILPKCYFDKRKCEFGIEALKQYQKEYNDKLQKFSDHPRHDWTSHAADAFRYLAVSFKERVDHRKMRPKKAKTSYDPFSEHDPYFNHIRERRGNFIGRREFSV